jgi:hypothetical protein
LNRFQFGFVFFKTKFQFGYFFDKNRTERKIIIPGIECVRKVIKIN